MTSRISSFTRPVVAVNAASGLWRRVVTSVIVHKRWNQPHQSTTTHRSKWQKFYCSCHQRSYSTTFNSSSTSSHLYGSGSFGVEISIATRRHFKLALGQRPSHLHIADSMCTHGGCRLHGAPKELQTLGLYSSSVAHTVPHSTVLTPNQSVRCFEKFIGVGTGGRDRSPSPQWFPSHSGSGEGEWPPVLEAPSGQFFSIQQYNILHNQCLSV